MTKVLAMLCCLGTSVAIAQPKSEPAAAAPTKITSDKARALVRALKLANVKSTKAKKKTTWTAKTLTCTTTKSDAVGAMEETICDVDGKKVTGAAAVVLEDGMTKAGVPSPYMMAKGGTKTEMRALTLACTHETDLGAVQEGGPFVCTYTPVSRPN